MKIHLLVYHVTTQHSLMHGHETHEVHNEDLLISIPEYHEMKGADYLIYEDLV